MGLGSGLGLVFVCLRVPIQKPSAQSFSLRITLTVKMSSSS